MTKKEEAKKELKELRNEWSRHIYSEGIIKRASLDMAIEALDKCDKIEQIISDWDNVPWGTSRTVMQSTLLKIVNVLEKEKG